VFGYNAQKVRKVHNLSFITNNKLSLFIYKIRKRQESSNDFNDRLIVNVALYYQKLMSSGTVAFVTNDAANRVNSHLSLSLYLSVLYLIVCVLSKGKCTCCRINLL